MSKLSAKSIFTEQITRLPSSLNKTKKIKNERYGKSYKMNTALQNKTSIKENNNKIPSNIPGLTRDDVNVTSAHTPSHDQALLVSIFVIRTMYRCLRYRCLDNIQTCGTAIDVDMSSDMKFWRGDVSPTSVINYTTLLLL